MRPLKAGTSLRISWNLKTKTMGVTLVSKDRKQAAQIFTLSGQKLSAPQKGLNIIGGKKVMMK